MAAVNNFYAENFTGTTFTNSTYGTLPTTCRILGSSLAANTKYLIVANASFGSNSLTDLVQIRIETADDANQASYSEAVVEANYTESTDKLHFQHVRSYTTDSSPADIGFNYLIAGGSTGRISAMSLLLIDLDDLGPGNYLEDSDDTDFMGDSGADGVGATVTCAAGTEYLLLGYCRADIGATNSSFRVMLKNDDPTFLTFHSAEGEDNNEFRMVGVAGRHYDASTSHTVSVVATQDSNKHASTHSYIIAIDTSAFEDFESVTVSTNYTGIDTGAPETINTISSYTPTTDGDHLVIGRFNQLTGGSSRIQCRLDIGGATHSSGYNCQNWDPDDAETIGLMVRQDVTGTTTINLDGHTKPGDTQGAVQYRFLGVLNLELVPSAAAPVFPRRQLATVRM